MQVSTRLKSSNRAIFSLACPESTVARRTAWTPPFFSAVWRLFRKIVLLRYSPRVGDRVELKDVQIQHATAKFYAIMRIGKGSTIAEYTVAIGCGLLCKQLLCQQPHNNYIHSSRPLLFPPPLTILATSLIEFSSKIVILLEMLQS